MRRPDLPHYNGLQGGEAYTSRSKLSCLGLELESRDQLAGALIAGVDIVRRIAEAG
jgi:hypothetical protein